MIACCAVVGTVVVYLLAESAVTRPSPEDETLTTIFVIHERILMYAAENGRVPKSLDELPELPDKSNKLVDGWSHRILYRVIDAKTVELASRGRGDPLSADVDAAYVRRFALRDESGRWNDPLCDWLPPNEGKR